MIFSQFSLFLIVWKGHVLLILRRTYSYDILLKIDCHTKVAIEQQNAYFFLISCLCIFWIGNVHDAFSDIVINGFPRSNYQLQNNSWISKTVNFVGLFGRCVFCHLINFFPLKINCERLLTFRWRLCFFLLSESPRWCWQDSSRTISNWWSYCHLCKYYSLS